MQRHAQSRYPRMRGSVRNSPTADNRLLPKGFHEHPTSPLRWTCKSRAKLAAALKQGWPGG